jgi:hypothetical protein
MGGRWGEEFVDRGFELREDLLSFFSILYLFIAISQDFKRYG